MPLTVEEVSLQSNDNVCLLAYLVQLKYFFGIFKEIEMIAR